MKIAAEMNTMMTEMEDTILKASINNQVLNATNIARVLEDLQYLIQSKIENQIFQIQQMLAGKLDAYKGKENAYVNDNIWEIQDLFKEENKKEEGHIEDEEVILIKPYKVTQLNSSTTSTTSFITDEVENLIKYMMFIQSPTQTRLFQPPPYYQSLKSRGEQDPEYWKKVAMALVDQNIILKQQGTVIQLSCFNEVCHMNHTL